MLAVVPAFAVAALLSSCTPEEVRVARLTNEDRTTASVAELEYNADLGEKAQRQADRMCSSGKLEHSVLGNGIPYPWRSFAENVGYGDSLEQINDKWMNEPAHRVNIMSKRFTHFGVGACQASDGTWFAVQELMQL